MDTILHDPRTITPNLVIDYDVIDETYERFLQNFPGGLIYYAVKALVLVLQRHPIPKRTEIIADMQLACWLSTAENAFLHKLEPGRKQ